MARLPTFLTIQSTTCKTALHVESCHHSDQVGDIERSFDEYRWEAGIAGGRESQIWNFHVILRRSLSRNVRRGCPRREHREIKRAIGLRWSIYNIIHLRINSLSWSRMTQTLC